MTDSTTFIATDDRAPSLAIDVLPDYSTGTFTWDQSYWDGPDLLAWGDGSPDWQNIVCDVTRVTINRGASTLQGVLTRAENGEMTVELDDTGRNFDPTVNGETIHPGTPMRARAWGYLDPFDDALDGGTITGGVVGVTDGGQPDVISAVLAGGLVSATGPAQLDAGDVSSDWPAEATDGGQVDADPRGRIDGGVPTQSRYWTETLFTGRITAGKGAIKVRYQPDGPPQVVLTVGDRIAPMSAWKAAGHEEPGVGGGDNLLERVGRVLAEMSMPPDTVLAGDLDTAYAATLASTALDRGWDSITEAADAELGQVWVDRYDRLVVRGRDSELSGPVRGTLSDVHDEIAAGPVHCCYSDADIVFDTDLLTNRAIAGRRIPDTDPEVPVPVLVAQVDDGASQARYGLVAVEDKSLELETDDQLLPWAQALVLGATEPRLRVDQVVAAPSNAPEAWPQVAATDIGDRWSFRQHPSVGDPVAMTLGVLGIRHEITPDEWVCEWTTVRAVTPGDANPSGWFTFDLSFWDDGDLLAPIGGTVSTS